MELLCGSPSVVNVVRLEGVAHKPVGDVILCDVAREDASVIIGDLKELEIPKHGSIAVETVDSAHLGRWRSPPRRPPPGLPSDAVVWEEVEQRTSENTELSLSFVAFMVLAMQIASVGILLDQPILIVGAMVVGPEFGPLAGLCVALVERRKDLARRSLVALGVGFPVAMLVTLLTVIAVPRAWAWRRRTSSRTTIRSPSSSHNPTSSPSSWPSWRAWPACSRSRTRSRGP